MKTLAHIFTTFLMMFAGTSTAPIAPPVQSQMFAVQSIDTMKYSRDLALQELQNEAFDATITEEMSDIKAAGANYVAIDTPYDSQFLPILARWVTAARAAGLGVWFRGNFSGWEGWFNYATITPAEHETMLNQFIVNNPTLFQNGDIFTPCPECENGGSGDPRQTGDVAGYRDFLETEFQDANTDFKKIGKSVTIYNSMNADVATLEMNPAAAEALGGTVLIDEYTSTPAEFGAALDSLASTSGAEVGIGEFGAPIPDLNSAMTADQQAQFVGALLQQAYMKGGSVPVMNYWVLQGGSTALVADDGTALEAYDELQQYYTAPYMAGLVEDSLGDHLPGIPVLVDGAAYSTTTNGGEYQVFLPNASTTITIGGNGYTSTTSVLERPATSSELAIILNPLHPNILYRIRKFLKSYFP